MSNDSTPQTNYRKLKLDEYDKRAQWFLNYIPDVTKNQPGFEMDMMKVSIMFLSNLGLALMPHLRAEIRKIVVNFIDADHAAERFENDLASKSKE